MCQANFSIAPDPRQLRGMGWQCPEHCTLHLAPYTVHPAPYTPYPAPCVLHPAPCTLHPALFIPHSAPCTLHPAQCKPNPASSCPLHPTSYPLHPTSCTPHPSSPPCTLEPCILHATPPTPHGDSPLTQVTKPGLLPTSTPRRPQLPSAPSASASQRCWTVLALAEGSVAPAASVVSSAHSPAFVFLLLFPFRCSSAPAQHACMRTRSI